MLLFWICTIGVAFPFVSQAQTLEVKIDAARGTHEFQLEVDGQPISGSSSYSLGQVEMDEYTTWFVRYSVGISPSAFPGSSFALRDLTVNETAAFFPNTAPDYVGDQLVDVRGAFGPESGSPVAYFAVPSSQANHSLVVVYPDIGLTAPLSNTTRIGVNPANSEDSWVEAIAPFYSGEDFYVLDLTTSERSTVNVTYLPGANWSLSIDDVPVDAWTFQFSGTDAGYHFMLTYGFPDSGTPMMTRILVPILDQVTGDALIEAPMPRGASFNIVRLVDFESVMDTNANPAGERACDLRGLFAVRPRRAQEFYVNATMEGEFVVRQPFFTTATQQIAYYQLMQYPDGYGGTNDFWYNTYFAEIDAGMGFALERNGVETLPENETTWWGGFDPNAPPPAQQFSIDLFWRSADGNYIIAPDGTNYPLIQGELLSESRATVWETAPMPQYELKYYRFSLSVITYPDAFCYRCYPDQWGNMSYEALSSGYYDRKELFPIATSLQFLISPSRLGHDLRIRQPHTQGEYFLNQNGSLGAYYEGGQLSYWFSTADGCVVSGLDFWVVDLSTNEMSAPNQTNLVSWVSMTAPVIDYITEGELLGDVVLGVRVNNLGAIRIELERRFADHSYDWTTVMSFEPSAYQNNLPQQITLTGQPLGESFLFRARAIYPGGQSILSEEVSTIIRSPNPAVYESITASPVGTSAGLAKLEWTVAAPTSQGIFRVQWRTSLSSPWLDVGSVRADEFLNQSYGNVHSYSFEPLGLAAAQTNHFRVRLSREADDDFENPSPVASIQGAIDSDGDGDSDDLEYLSGTDPNTGVYPGDTDGDGISDIDELSAGTDPLRKDAPNVKLKVLGFTAP